jgi:hypothetical protein
MASSAQSAVAPAHARARAAAVLLAIFICLRPAGVEPFIYQGF